MSEFMRALAARILVLLVCAAPLAAAPLPAPAPPEPDELTTSAPAAPANSRAAPPAYRPARFLGHASVIAFVFAGVLVGIALARRGRALPIRDFPGLLAFEEAVGRAAEMGRPALFTCGGTCEIRRVQLFASMPLLREAARLSATLDNRLIVPVAFPETLPVHANVVRDTYLAANALDRFRADDIRFFPGMQFFFAMAATGWMLQEQPAACFYFGWWEGDALMFAETGQTVGALQIAGTDQLYQVPFFVAACDYTIIGEEFWAASAKISRDPQLLGSLGAQDVFKLAMLALIVGGTLLCLHPQVAGWLDYLRKTFA